MERYSWLLKRHKKAMRVFEDARRSLDKVCETITMELSLSQVRIEELNQSIREENEAIDFLTSELNRTKVQSDKISAIINP